MYMKYFNNRARWIPESDARRARLRLVLVVLEKSTCMDLELKFGDSISYMFLFFGSRVFLHNNIF